MATPEAAPAHSIVIARAELTAEVSRGLVAALNAELSGAYPEAGATHFGLDPAEVSGRRGAFLVIYQEGNAVGCGAVRLVAPQTGELKRMYVAPAVRGRGLGRRLVAALEAEARALGARRLILETGIRQAAAIALYRGTGFERFRSTASICGLRERVSVSARNCGNRKRERAGILNRNI